MLAVKISDFGLAHEISETDYYEAQGRSKAMPVRWMSIEAIEHGILTMKNDVVCFSFTCRPLLALLRNRFYQFCLRQ